MWVNEGRAGGEDRVLWVRVIFVMSEGSAPRTQLNAGRIYLRKAHGFPILLYQVTIWDGAFLWCMRVLQRSRTNRTYIHIHTHEICLLCLMNWHTHLWCLGSPRSVCTGRLQTQESWGCRWSPKAVWSRIPSRSGKQVFCSIQVFNWLNETHSHYGRQSALPKVHQFKC